jgi:hypothetical protein
MRRSSDSGPVILIDGDPIVYRSGFAAETPGYECAFETSSGDLVQTAFRPRDNNSAGELMHKFFEENPDITTLYKDRFSVVQPLNFALQIVKQQIESIIDSCKKDLSNLSTVRLYLSGTNNFRDKLATIRPYKGNRDRSHRPIHYEAIRKYMAEEWAAHIIDGHEADDEVSIVARQLARERRGFVVATIDKDLDQIPGQHYNYMKRVSYDVSDDEAVTFFYEQVLSGDVTDNIAGARLCGPAKAKRIVSGVVERADRRSVDLEAELWEAAVAEYAAGATRPGCEYSHMSPDAAALENARLVKMLEYPRQLWTPPGLPDETIKE